MNPRCTHEPTGLWAKLYALFILALGRWVFRRVQAAKLGDALLAVVIRD